MTFCQSRPITARLSGCSSMVELQSSKLITWVRFPSPAPVCKLGERNDAHVAQSVEHFLGKEEVIGSIPIMGSRLLREHVAS